MRIGELAKRTGTTTRALRFYEDQGLLAARRAANGYREYDEDDLQLVTEILKLQTVGLSLDETRPFVDCLRSGHETGDACPSSIEMYRRKLAEADAVLARLGAIRADLAGKLADALARQDPACAPDPCVVPERL
ncbi:MULTISPECIES: MerR family transcriptional regulator [unclassified Amycolatopsis]|uniref:MerR family transcriptional regulator n=1 Tax=unclassified Amycolatopsis TaxID=2618356 RepID=UPI001FF43E38|nr:MULTISPECIES: MerR family transcriptional regulator [unclassified Amycolatopsis]UOZ04550.1 MerR family transcriptional regulator [Amycolatopsis sp. WQ 127309]WSJ80040.1 MerR family transcriptional regulator [Amycolatopsis sp. NBC_01307]WSK76468.1 MerR family transcriptional regulator [Amycolatopsis sp. NBC_01286]